MPASSAAGELPPTASRNNPSAVRRSSAHSAMKIAAPRIRRVGITET